MADFSSTNSLLGTVVVAGTTLIGLKLATDFISSAISNTQKSLPKSNNYYPKPFKSYKKMNYGYDNYYSKKRKKQDIFSIKF